MEFKNFVEELKGKQHKLDKNKNGKLDAHDFKILRKEESAYDKINKRYEKLSGRTLEKSAQHYTDVLNKIEKQKKDWDAYVASKNTTVKEDTTIDEGRMSQRHPLEDHPYHKKTNAELVHIAKDAHSAAEAMKSHNTDAENKYRDQANDSATVRYWRQKNGMPDWYKKKYGHIKESFDAICSECENDPCICDDGFVTETTGVTNYNPKSHGGTRKELLAKYHKSKDSKDAEAARRAGATQKELQGVAEEVESIDEISSGLAMKVSGERFKKAMSMDAKDPNTSSAFDKFSKSSDAAKKKIHKELMDDPIKANKSYASGAEDDRKRGLSTESVMKEDTDMEEKIQMVQSQLHFIKYAADEILEYIDMGGEVEEWYQVKIAKTFSEFESLHSFMEGESRRTGMKEEVSANPIQYAVKHKLSKKILSTHKDLASAKDEWKDIDKDERQFYYVVTHNKSADNVNMKEDAFDEAAYHDHDWVEKTSRHERLYYYHKRMGNEEQAAKHKAEIDRLYAKRSNESFDEDGNLVESPIRFSDFISNLVEYDTKGGVYRHKGSYGSSYQGDDDDAPKKSAEPAVKRGRGRPVGSTSAARQKGSSAEKSYGGLAFHSLNLPNTNK